MNKFFTTTAASMLAVLLAGTAAAQADSKPVDRNADVSRARLVQRLDAQFAKLDNNKDGTISAAERQDVRSDRVEKRFKRIDADGNGSVTLSEMKAAHGRRGGAPGEQRPDGAKHRVHHGHGRGFVRAGLDANKDGQISKAEFQSKALERFDRADADRNGILTAAERQQARTAMMAKRAR